MENTLENKAKFFAQYWGQKVIKATSMADSYIKEFTGKIFKDQYLLLKPLSSITDEDAAEIAKILKTEITINTSQSIRMMLEGTIESDPTTPAILIRIALIYLILTILAIAT